jgi:hypothetical protein
MPDVANAFASVDRWSGRCWCGLSSRLCGLHGVSIPQADQTGLLWCFQAAPNQSRGRPDTFEQVETSVTQHDLMGYQRGRRYQSRCQPHWQQPSSGIPESLLARRGMLHAGRHTPQQPQAVSENGIIKETKETMETSRSSSKVHNF